MALSLALSFLFHLWNMNVWALFSLLISLISIFSAENRQDAFCTPPIGSIWRAGCQFGSPPYGAVNIQLMDDFGGVLHAALHVKSGDQASFWVADSKGQGISSRYYKVDLSTWPANTLYIGMQINGTNVTMTDLHGTTKTGILDNAFNFTRVNVTCTNVSAHLVPAMEIDVYTGIGNPFAKDYTM